MDYPCIATCHGCGKTIECGPCPYQGDVHNLPNEECDPCCTDCSWEHAADI